MTLSKDLLTDIDIVEGQLFQTILDLFIGGTETTTNTLRWMLLYLINNPHVQNKCQDEINKVGDGNLHVYSKVSTMLI